MILVMNTRMSCVDAGDEKRNNLNVLPERLY